MLFSQKFIEKIKCKLLLLFIEAISKFIMFTFQPFFNLTTQ